MSYTEKDLVTPGWEDYELLDSGNHRKLERFGRIILIRPETQAIWAPLRPGAWEHAHAEFRMEKAKGIWIKHKELPETWPNEWRDIHYTVRPTAFKHVGVFPEQAINWEWIDGCVRKLDKPRVLNLFGYTGIASLVAVRAGAHVTHVDASRQSVQWAKDNAELSHISPESFRFILEDATAFVKREARRGSTYHGIILDPPAFGRGAKHEVWHIEEHLAPLLQELSTILAPTPNSFLLLNGYAAGYTPSAFGQLLAGIFPKTAGSFGELRIQQADSDYCLSSGIYGRFVRT
ncbi:MAG: class I SAM-dependent methyltransferase [Patescibacteria group bacterium]